MNAQRTIERLLGWAWPATGGFVAALLLIGGPARADVVREPIVLYAAIVAPGTASPDPLIITRIPQATSTPIAAAVIEASLPQTPYELFRASLALSTWPSEEWTRVERIVGSCENRTYDPALHGDYGLAVGYLQIRKDWHPELAARYDLEDPLQNLNAGYELQQTARAMRLPSPWAACEVAR